MRRQADLAAVRPYGDHLDDGLMALTFTLPVPYTLAARKAALTLVGDMGLVSAEIGHYQRLADGYTYFVVHGRWPGTVDYEAISQDGLDIAFLSEDEVDELAEREVGHRIVVVGASTGSDTHSVGIDAMLNLKGFDGRRGLEGYTAFEAHNLGSQVANGDLVARAIELRADVILVSQTVSQQNLHLHNLTELVELVEAEGCRGDMILVCGGPRVSMEIAKELGYDAGFSKGTYPNHLATFLVGEMVSRLRVRAGDASEAGRT